MKRNDYLMPDLCRGEGLLSIVLLSLPVAVWIAVARSGLTGFDWLLFAETTLLLLSIVFLGVTSLCRLQRRRRLANLRVFTALAYLLMLILTGICSYVGLWIKHYWWLESSQGFSAWRVAENVILAAIPTGVLLRYLVLQQRYRLQQSAELEARIQALQSRIRPHFLFNSMNLIASLIASDPEKAEQVVEDLSDLFRYALGDSQNLIPLRDEIALCRRYLDLERLRLGDRLQVQWRIGDYGDGISIPCLTLQPLLENAIYHGVQMLEEGGCIDITVSRKGNRIGIDVTNPRHAVLEYNRGNRMAKENVRRRLEAHFGSSASVESEATENSFTTKIRYTMD